jgi:hypothetical protein
MFEYVSYEKIRDKIILSIIVLVVFGFLYTTLDKNDVGYDNSDLYNTFTRSLGIQILRFDLFEQKGIAFLYSMCQSILSYIIIIM